MTFYGTYNHNLDVKGRLVVPARFRDLLKASGTLYLMHGFDGALSVYPEDAFQKEMAFINALNYRDENARTYARIVLASIEPLPVDSAGRITIPTKILKKYNINQAVVVLGVGAHLEIWDSVAYENYEERNISRFSEIADQLGAQND